VTCAFKTRVDSGLLHGKVMSTKTEGKMVFGSKSRQRSVHPSSIYNCFHRAVFTSFSQSVP
jgi:hypothetical protein